MNATLNLNANTSSDRLQWSLHQSNNNNKTTYYFPHTTASSRLGSAAESDEEEKKEAGHRHANDSYTTNSTPTRTPALFFDEENLLMESTSRIVVNSNTFPPKALHKSNSYCGVTRSKSTVLKRDSMNGRIATSLTDDDIGTNNYRVTLYAAAAPNNDFTSNIPNNYDDDAIVDLPDENDLLMPFGVDAGDGVFVGVGGSSINSAPSARRSVCGTSKTRNPFFNRISHNRKCFVGLLLLLIAVSAFLILAYLTRDYTKQLLMWIEMQNSWIIVGILIALFVLVSFPIVVGYFVLMLTSGYLFGALKGALIVMVGANIGVAVSHLVIRNLRHRIPIHKIIKNETGRAILRVISGPKAFRVVLFTRLTPIPFGLQNTIFAVSAVNPRAYHTASLIGLMPAQIINTYLGSTLRSMQEVLSSHGPPLTGYISFGLEVICGVTLMIWVIQKARKELAQTLLADLSNQGKLIEIDV